VAVDEGEEVLRAVAGEGGLGEVGVLREEVGGGAVDVGEVAAASAGNEDFAAGLAAVFEKGDAAAALAGSGGAHQAGCARAEDNDIELARGVHGFRSE